MSDDQPVPALLQRAVDDRAAHPWRYYRLEHDDMKRMLDQLSQRAEAAEADRDRLIARVQHLIQEWRDRVEVCRRIGAEQVAAQKLALAQVWEEEAAITNACADQLAAALTE